jgi:hypothetical protein
MAARQNLYLFFSFVVIYQEMWWNSRSSCLYRRGHFSSYLLAYLALRVFFIFTYLWFIWRRCQYDKLESVDLQGSKWVMYFKSMWKGAVVAQLEYFPVNLLEGLGEPRKTSVRPRFEPVISPLQVRKVTVWANSLRRGIILQWWREICRRSCGE